MVDFDSLGDHDGAGEEPPEEPTNPGEPPRKTKKELAIQTLRRITKKPPVSPVPTKK